MEVTGQLHAPDLYPRDKASSTNRKGGCVGPRVSLDATEKTEFSCPFWNLNPSHPVCRPVAIPTELPNVPSQILNIHISVLGDIILIYQGNLF